MLKTLERPRVAKTEIIVVTPEIAQAWLDKNHENRKPVKRYVDQYARDMKSGSWAMTYDPIRFDSDSNLIDGQHRLLACIQAKKSFETVVVYGLPKNCKNLIDTGRSRTPRDIFAMQGMGNTSHVATAIRILLMEKYGGDGKNAFTHTDYMAALNRHPALPMWVPSTNNSAVPYGISRGAVGYVAYIGAHILGKKNRVNDMLAVLKSGIPDYDGDPIHKYRERILRQRAEGSLRGDRQAGFWTLKHCWNLFSARHPIEKLHLQKETVAIKGLDLKSL